MRLCSPKRTDELGFSLIEAIVALAIVGLALGATAGAFSTGLQGQQTAESVNGALALVESKIAEAEASPALRPGSSEGVSGGRYKWRVTITPYRDGNAGTVEKPDAASRLFRIAATAEWRDGHRQRQISLATVRLSPAVQ